MNNLIFELGFLMGLTLNPNYQEANKQRPYFMVEKNYDSMYFRGYAESELDSMNTKESLAQFEIGYQSNGLRIGLGHNTEFETWSIKGYNKSFDYLKVSYRLELK
jgi:hypothetical protein